jgi:CubicO group peptidase (beta-lactamase class C family)
MKIYVVTIVTFILLIGCQKNLDPINHNPISQYFNENLLNEALEEADNIDDLYSLLVGKNGELIIENYYNGFAQDSLHDVRSVTKSVTSILVGIAIDKGYISDTNQLMHTFISPLVDSFPTDKLQITIENLLTMSGGFEWAPFGDWSEYNSWRNADDQINYILNKPVVNTPGQIFNYNDAASHLLSVIVSEATGMDLVDFAQQNLFDPLDINFHSWIRDNRNYPLGCVALSLTAQDMFKMGTLFLQKGMFNGRRIISEGWIHESTSTKIATGNAIPFGANYGYLWWVDETEGKKYYMAMGYGGQFIQVIPEKNLVIVATCNWRLSSNQTSQNWYNIISLIVDKIISATK